MENKVFVVLLHKFCVVCSYVLLLGLSLNSHSDFQGLLDQIHLWWGTPTINISEARLSSSVLLAFQD